MKLKLFSWSFLLSYQSPLMPRLSPWLLLKKSYYSKTSSSFSLGEETEIESRNIPTSGIGRPLSEILKELNKKVPDTLVRQRLEDGFSIKYIPWHVVNRIMNLHAPEWSGEVRNVTYSTYGKSVSVVYRVTLYRTDAETHLASISWWKLHEKSMIQDDISIDLHHNPAG